MSAEWYGPYLDDAELAEIQAMRQELAEMRYAFEAGREQEMEDALVAEIERRLEALPGSDDEKGWILNRALMTEVGKDGLPDIDRAAEDFRRVREQPAPVAEAPVLPEDAQPGSAAWTQWRREQQQYRERQEVDRAAAESVADGPTGDVAPVDLDNGSERRAYMADRLAAKEYEG